MRRVNWSDGRCGASRKAFANIVLSRCRRGGGQSRRKLEIWTGYVWCGDYPGAVDASEL